MVTAATPESIHDLGSPPIDEVGVAERAARLASRSIKKQSKVQALEMALSMIDLTTLEGADTPGRVRQLCAKAKQLHRPTTGLELDVPKVAAVCVYPTLVAEARSQLDGTGIHIASVATGFPSGQVPIEAKLTDTPRGGRARGRRDRHGDSAWRVPERPL